MNKKILVLFAAIILSVKLPGADLTTESGVIYKNAEVRQITAGCVQIVHDKGNATIVLDELPDDFIAALSSRQRLNLQNLVDIKLKNGKLCQKCTLTIEGKNRIRIDHLTGTEKVAFDDLPDKLQATFSRAQLQKLSGKVKPAKRQGKKAVRDKASGEKTGDGKVIYQGPRGGRYYFNDNGKKVYIRN